jgi:hypothetical protein
MVPATRGRRSEGATGEWSGFPARLAGPRNTASPTQYKLHLPTRTPRLPVVDWTVAPAESHGLGRFAERRNLVSAHVPSNPNCTIAAGKMASHFWVTLLILTGDTSARNTSTLCYALTSWRRDPLTAPLLHNEPTCQLLHWQATALRRADDINCCTASVTHRPYNT